MYQGNSNIDVFASGCDKAFFVHSGAGLTWCGLINVTSVSRGGGGASGVIE